MRDIIADDDALQAGIKDTLQEYNLEQFITADVPGCEHLVRYGLYLLRSDCTLIETTCFRLSSVNLVGYEVRREEKIRTGSSILDRNRRSNSII